MDSENDEVSDINKVGIVQDVYLVENKVEGNEKPVKKAVGELSFVLKVN